MSRYLRCYLSFVVCFFQAEDGIRDLVRSRGLGDVYKRQIVNGNTAAVGGSGASGIDYGNFPMPRGFTFGFKAVSYTHLTLPTSDLV